MFIKKRKTIQLTISVCLFPVICEGRRVTWKRQGWLGFLCFKKKHTQKTSVATEYLDDMQLVTKVNTQALFCLHFSF